MRNAYAQFNALQEQLYGRINYLSGFLDHRLRTLESSFEAHQQSTKRLIHTLHDQFQAQFHQNHTVGMQALRGMLEQLLADRSSPAIPAAPSPPASGSQSAPAFVPHPPMTDLLHLGAPPPTAIAASAAHAHPEFRVVHIPTLGTSFGLQPPRLSRAMLPHTGWSAPLSHEPSQAAPHPDLALAQPHYGVTSQQHLVRGPKLLYDIKPRLSPHMVSLAIR